MGVLIVEDEAIIAFMLGTMLETLGYRVIGTVGDVGRALDLIEARRLEIDAAILDANLGGDSAAPVAMALRRHGIPFVLASGYEADELAHLGLPGAGLRKPYRKADVGRVLAGLVGEKSGER